MRKLILFLLLALTLCGFVSSQSRSSRVSYGSRGLAITEEILTKLNLPSWYWNGAHEYENVERHFGLVDGKLLDEYLSSQPSSGLNDPQNILNPEQREKIESLISDHDMKSAMPLNINVLRHGQTIALMDEEFKQRLIKQFKNQTAIVVFYFYGYARGAKGYILLDGAGFIDDWEVDELFIKSSRDASLQLEDFLELESFITDVSKRSFWIEQRLMPPVVAERRDEKEIKVNEKQAEWDKLSKAITEHSFTLFLALCVLASGGWYYLWSRRWRKFIIADRDVPVRLGANFGATVSDLIEFSDPKVSLTEQYEKLKNREL
jgi:hypothetical protein